MDKNEVWRALHVFRRVSSGKGPARITQSCELKVTRRPFELLALQLLTEAGTTIQASLAA